MKIPVRFLAENDVHEVEADPSFSAFQFKKLLRQQIPFFKSFPDFPTEVMKLSLEGFDGGELMGNVMEDDRLLSTYPLTEEIHPVLLALERPVEKIGCPSCQQPFAQWSIDRLCCGNANGEETDQEKLEKRKNRIPQLLNCGHAVCLECFRIGMCSDEPVVDETTTENASRRGEQETIEKLRIFVCPVENCRITTYWSCDQERSSHEGMQRLVHLKKREWTEADKAKERCCIKFCGAEAMFFCGDCGSVKHCLTHFNRMHQFEDTSDHTPQLLLASQIHSSIADIFKTRYCCYCGGGEAASCGSRGGGRPHCEHRDAGLVSARETTKAKAMEQLMTLGNLQADCWRQLTGWNGVMHQLQEHQAKGEEKIRKEFDDFIAKVDAKKEDMLSQLRRHYREKEMELLEKMEALGRIAGEVEAGLVHHRQSLASEGGDTHVIRDVADVSVLQDMVSQMTSETSSESLAQYGAVAVKFDSTSTQGFIEEFCQIVAQPTISTRFRGPEPGIHNFALVNSQLGSGNNWTATAESPQFKEMSPRKVSKMNETSLLEAAKKGILQEVENLVECGVSVNCKDQNGQSPLHESASTGHIDVMKFLLHKEADIHCVTNSGATPLHFAAHFGQLEAVKYLLQNGADKTIKTMHGKSPFDVTGWGGVPNDTYDAIKQLLR